MNYFVTNREIIRKNRREGIREDGREHAGDNLRFGSYDLQSRAFNLFPEPRKDEDLLFASRRRREVSKLHGSTRFFTELYHELVKGDVAKTPDGQDKGDVLFFIHGFNTDLEGVREAFENLNRRFVDNPDSPIQHVIIFTWPGRSPKVPYHYFDDRKDAIRSGETLARGFHKLIDFFRIFLARAGNQPCQRNLHFMAHSMAGRVVKHMMSELSFKPELFKKIILIASDIEYDIFEPQHEFHSLVDLGETVHVYYHEKDRVLDISKWTKNFSNRLGRYGRKRRDSSLKQVIDCNVTHVSDDSDYGVREDQLNHWYYYSSTEVVNDLIAVFKGEASRFSIK